MRARIALLLLMVLLASACGGDSGTATTTTGGDTTTTAGETTTTTEPGFTVTSDDGAVTLDVPIEAMADDPGITITVLDPADYPPELEGAAQNPNSRIYRLLPDALTFDAPARITRTIDADNFGELIDYEIPIAVLLVRDPDGEYEPLDDLHVMRRGDEVEVSGDITHFSTLVTVSEQQTMTLQPGASHSGFATEEGVELFMEALFEDLGGSPLTVPSGIEGWGRSRSEQISFRFNGTAGVTCTEPGEEPINTRIGFWVNLDAGAAAGGVGLRTTPLLVPGIERLPVLVKSMVPISCIDPGLSLLGEQVDLRLQTDHPGDEVYIPNADFRGGLSGSWGTISLRARPEPSLRFDYIGLICDLNRNGVVDPTDAMYQPYPIDFSTVDMGQFVLPLFGQADYFAYGLDSTQFGNVIMTDSFGMPLSEALSDMFSWHNGEGRPEAAFGVFGDTSGPTVYTVGPAEDAHEGTYETIQVWYRAQF